MLTQMVWFNREWIVSQSAVDSESHDSDAEIRVMQEVINGRLNCLQVSCPHAKCPRRGPVWIQMLSKRPGVSKEPCCPQEIGDARTDGRPHTWRLRDWGIENFLRHTKMWNLKSNSNLLFPTDLVCNPQKFTTQPFARWGYCQFE